MQCKTDRGCVQRPSEYAQGRIPRHSAMNEGWLAEFGGNPLCKDWMEIYFSHRSNPTWSIAQISYKKDDDAWIPFGRYMLIDADNVKPGFRAFRIQAHRLEFRLSDYAETVHHPADGSNHVIKAPGRYVVSEQNMLKRVGNADVVECIRCEHGRDRYVEIYYHSNPVWRKAFLTYSLNGLSKWVCGSMRICAAGGDVWFHRVGMSRCMEFAITDGGDEWDNNDRQNYSVRLPGKYVVVDKTIRYLGRSDADMHDM